eukprot:357794-Chlamydomonas_euryale.AAC.14
MAAVLPFFHSHVTANVASGSVKHNHHHYNNSNNKGQIAAIAAAAAAAALAAAAACGSGSASASKRPSLVQAGSAIAHNASASTGLLAIASVGAGTLYNLPGATASGRRSVRVVAAAAQATAAAWCQLSVVQPPLRGDRRGRRRRRRRRARQANAASRRLSSSRSSQA